ncbi:ribosome maturation factor RimP [Streptoalloteichus hindustanus]|uniref:Ribosome maturation factor RimP n=1 Tax=Streptoalloteichus hindustanus TaxID=2017 RepID=A0A1M5AZQ4_STRHI|nr:ribosome maturation factor RimP [Streptoalloteichus hindustanus]SHF35728.1 ribosome maturation factor RimP [Streptoalloteichus hindustanus]
MSSPPRGEPPRAERGDRVASRAARDQFTAQLEPVVRAAVQAVGFDLELLDVQPAGRRRLVRVVVDSDDGVGLDEVAEASRAVSAALDARDDLLAGPYTLEVTSPGVDRPLTRPRHWRRARLRLVAVRLADGGELTGRVGDADEEGVVLLVDGELRRLAYQDVARATVEIEFRQPAAADLALLGGGAASGGDAGEGGAEDAPETGDEEGSR